MQYLYRCGLKHEQEIEHPVKDLDKRWHCPVCGGIMHRVPQAFAVNWNGLPPHLADFRPPVLQQYLKDAPENQARYLDTKDKK